MNAHGVEGEVGDGAAHSAPGQSGHGPKGVTPNETISAPGEGVAIFSRAALGGQGRTPTTASAGRLGVRLRLARSLHHTCPRTVVARGVQVP